MADLRIVPPPEVDDRPDDDLFAFAHGLSVLAAVHPQAVVMVLDALDRSGEDAA